MVKLDCSNIVSYNWKWLLSTKILFFNWHWRSLEEAVSQESGGAWRIDEVRPTVGVDERRNSVLLTWETGCVCSLSVELCMCILPLTKYWQLLFNIHQSYFDTVLPSNSKIGWGQLSLSLKAKSKGPNFEKTKFGLMSAIWFQTRLKTKLWFKPKG